MRYRIEYADGRCCNFANSRKDLLEWLKLLKDEEITDIRKIYKNGVTDSVLEKYRNYVNRMPDRKERQDERHTIYFENHFVACDVCFGSNKTVYGVPCRNISSYLPEHCRFFSSDSIAMLWLWSGKFWGMSTNGIGWIPVLSTAKYG